MIRRLAVILGFIFALCGLFAIFFGGFNLVWRVVGDNPPLAAPDLFTVLLFTFGPSLILTLRIFK